MSLVVALHVGDVVVDLAESTFLDVGAVWVLATAQQLLDDDGRRLTFRSPTEEAFRALLLFGLADLIEAQTGQTS